MNSSRNTIGITRRVAVKAPSVGCTQALGFSECARLRFGLGAAAAAAAAAGSAVGFVAQQAGRSNRSAPGVPRPTCSAP